jgi:hypothetical protein
MAKRRLADKLAEARTLLAKLERGDRRSSRPSVGDVTDDDIAILRVEIRCMEMTLARVPDA